jgi:hypothetical protein
MVWIKQTSAFKTLNEVSLYHYWNCLIVVPTWWVRLDLFATLTRPCRLGSVWAARLCVCVPESLLRQQLISFRKLSHATDADWRRFQMCGRVRAGHLAVDGWRGPYLEFTSCVVDRYRNIIIDETHDVFSCNKCIILLLEYWHIIYPPTSQTLCVHWQSTSQVYCAHINSLYISLICVCACFSLAITGCECKT